MRKATTISAFEFFQLFPNEDSARTHIETIRWAYGRPCPHCGELDNSFARRGKRLGYYKCYGCKKEFTVRTGSVFERSHVPLNKWLFAIYLLETSRKGISSLQLSKELGITQKSAWFVLHRLRESCGVEYKNLFGTVEIDETYIGGLEENRHEHKKSNIGRGSSGKQAVLGMREREGRVKAIAVSDIRRRTLQGYITDNVAVGSTIYTDDHRSYTGLRRKAYTHKTVKHSVKEYVNGMVYTNGIESVWAVLKRGYKGIYHNFSFKHMQRYINEFTFRLNEGNCSVDTIDRINQVLSHSFNKRLTYKELID